MRTFGRIPLLAALAASFLGAVSPLGAQMPIERALEEIRSFPIEGVTLDTPPAEARALLEQEGFEQVSVFGRPDNPSGWNYLKSDVRVSLESFAGVLVRIERRQRARRDSDVIDGTPLVAQVQDFFALTDDDCVRSGDRTDCSVADEPARPTHLVTAQIVPFRTILRATLIFRSGAR